MNIVQGLPEDGEWFPLRISWSTSPWNAMASGHLSSQWFKGYICSFLPWLYSLDLQVTKQKSTTTASNTCVFIYLFVPHQRKFSRKLPSYGRWSFLAFTPSCQPQHQVVESGSVWIQGWKHFWAQNPVFLRYGSSWGCEMKVGFVLPRRGGGVDVDQKVHETVERARFHQKNAKYWGVRSSAKKQ